jgi:hypothetical protein
VTRALLNVVIKQENTLMGSKYLGIGVAMGIAIGAAVGTVEENLATWVGMGAAVGVAVGFALAIVKAARSKH